MCSTIDDNNKAGRKGVKRTVLSVDSPTTIDVLRTKGRPCIGDCSEKSITPGEETNCEEVREESRVGKVLSNV